MASPKERSEGGATAVEYALLVALIAAVMVTAVIALGLVTGDLVDRPCQELAGTASACT